MIHFFIFIYTLITLIVMIPALPFLLLMFPLDDLKKRFGVVKNPQKGYIWFHCASVGEVNALLPLITKFRSEYPQKKILLTTMTVTGQNRAKQIAECDMVSFLPLDFLPFMLSFYKRTEPELLVIVETELWLTLLYTARLFSVPVCLINGRISDKTFKRYRFLSLFTKQLFRYTAFTGTQSQLDKERFSALGFSNVHNTHNLKFSLQLPNYEPETVRREWLLEPEHFVLVWGSSRPGEEELLISLYEELKKNIPQLKIIIAPRHLKRLNSILPLFNNIGYTLLSELNREYDLLIIDSMGVLNKAYAIADLAIVGGSFYDFGGHNPLEPGYYSVPAIIGNYYSSCRQSVKTMLKNDAIKLSNRENLLADILLLFNNEEMRKNIGTNAKKTLDINSESVDENLAYLTKYLKPDTQA